jgi:hypothetical protein
MTAIEQSGSLAGLMQLQKQSAHYLSSIQSVLPPGLGAQIKAGPIDQDGWCLLVQHNAAGAKLRQLLPAISAHLRAQGHPVQQIRVKVMSQG